MAVTSENNQDTTAEYNEHSTTYDRRKRKDIVTSYRETVETKILENREGGGGGGGRERENILGMKFFHRDSSKDLHELFHERIQRSCSKGETRRGPCISYSFIHFMHSLLGDTQTHIRTAEVGMGKAQLFYNIIPYNRYFLLSGVVPQLGKEKVLSIGGLLFSFSRVCYVQDGLVIRKRPLVGKGFAF